MTEHDPAPNTLETEPNADVRVRELLPYAAAAPLLGITTDAVRMRCSRGLLVCERVGGRRRVVWPQPEPETEHVGEPNAEPSEHERGSVRTGRGSVRSSADPLTAALELRLAETQRDRDRWRDAHDTLSRQHELALQLVAAANAAIEAERDRVARLESRLVNLTAIAPTSATSATSTATGSPPVAQIEPPGAAPSIASAPDPSTAPRSRLRSWWRRGSRSR
jgi:hypothetical protein